MRPILVSSTVRDVAGRGWEFSVLGPSDRPNGDQRTVIAVRRSHEDTPSFFEVEALESVMALLTEQASSSDEPKGA